MQNEAFKKWWKEEGEELCGDCLLGPDEVGVAERAYAAGAASERAKAELMEKRLMFLVDTYYACGEFNGRFDCGPEYEWGIEAVASGKTAFEAIDAAIAAAEGEKNATD